MEKRKELTESQKKVYDYIKDYFIAYKIMPNVREIGEKVELSHQRVRVILNRLQVLEYIDVYPSVSRGIIFKDIGEYEKAIKIWRKNNG